MRRRRRHPAGAISGAVTEGVTDRRARLALAIDASAVRGELKQKERGGITLTATAAD